MTASIVFDPLLPWWLIAALAALLAAGIALALIRGLSGWALRGLAGLVMLAALTGPSYQQEERDPLSDIVLMVEDETASQSLGDRAGMTDSAAEALAARIAARDNTELRRITVQDGPDNSGTRLMTALSEALAEEPSGPRGGGDPALRRAAARHRARTGHAGTAAPAAYRPRGGLGPQAQRRQRAPPSASSAKRSP